MPSRRPPGVLRRSIVANFVGRGWSSVLSLAVVPIYLRLIGVEAYALVGIYAMLVTVLNIFDLGLSATVTREVARYSIKPDKSHEARDLVRTLEFGYWAVGLLFGVCVMLCSSFIAQYWVKPRSLSIAAVQQSIAIMGAALVLQWPLTFYAGGLMGLQRQVAVNVINSITATVRAVGTVVVLLFVSSTVQTFFVCQAGASGIQTVATVWYLWKTLPGQGRPAFRWTMLRDVWRFAAGMGSATIAMIILSQFDKVVLSTTLSLDVFGYYVIAWNVASAIAIPLVPVTEALFPRLSQLAEQNDVGEITRLYHAGCRLVAFLICPAAALLVTSAWYVARLWTGSPATATHVAPLLTILVIGTTLNALTMSLLDLLQMAFGWLRPFVTARVIAVAVGGPLLIWFSLRYGAPGAAYAWLLVYCGYAILTPHWVFRRLLPTEKWRWYLHDLAVPFTVALATGLIFREVVAVPDSRIGSAAYLGALFAFCSSAVGLTIPEVRRAASSIVAWMGGLAAQPRGAAPISGRRASPAITVLADPIPIGWYSVKEPAKAAARRLRDIARPRPKHMRSRYRGHFAVTRSIVEGLQKVGVPVSYNPRTPAQCGEVVLVPAGYDALRQAIGWKKRGSIRCLLAGPNLVDFPSERRELMCAPEIDWLLVHGPWFRDNFINDCPELQGRVVPTPAGVDTTYWSPNSCGDERPHVLVYEKHKVSGSPPVIQPYSDALKRYGYEVVHLRYGEYLQEEYRELLRGASLLVGFSPEESQGIAWAEAWSMNVPTFLWNQEKVTYKGRTYRASSAPYLTDQVGRFFSTCDEFEQLLILWRDTQLQFAPRAWVLNNMSDEACAHRICALCAIAVPGKPEQ